MREPRVAFGPFLFDPNSRILFRDGAELPLPPRVTGVLDVLLRRAGDVVPRQELIDSVWKDAFVTDTSLAEAVSALRQALGDDAQSPVYVQTLHRRGYRFVATVTTLPVNTHAPVPHVQPGTFDSSIPNPSIPNPSIPNSSIANPSIANPQSSIANSVAKPSLTMELVPWSIATLCVVLAASAVWYSVFRQDAPPPPVARFVVSANDATRFDTRAPAIAISPDGATLAWSACDRSGCRLYVRALDALSASAMAGSDDAAAPFFSPDGKWIGFFADGRLKKVALAGGAPVTLTDAPQPLGGAWTEDGHIIFAGFPFGGLMRIADDGSGLAALTTPNASAGEVRHAWPALAPAGRLVLFTIVSAPDVRAGGRLGVMRVGSNSWRAFLSGITVARPLADDVIAFSRGEEVHAVRFDTQRLELSGAPQVVPGINASGGLQLATARDTLVAAAARESRPRFAWRTSDGSLYDVPDIRPLHALRLSPDGGRVVGMDTVDGNTADIWIADVQRGTSTRLTHGGINASPVWTNDGKAVVFASRSNGIFELWRRDADATRPSERLLRSDTHVMPASAGGSDLAFIRAAANGRADVWLLPVAGGPARVLIETPFDEINAALSPDGKLVAYQSNESGRWEVYLLRRADNRKTIVSNAGGIEPVWAADGRLLYRSSGRVMSVTVQDTADLHAATPAVYSNTLLTVVGTTAEGRAFVELPRAAPDQGTIVLHAERALRALLGPPSATLPR